MLQQQSREQRAAQVRCTRAPERQQGGAFCILQVSVRPCMTLIKIFDGGSIGVWGLGRDWRLEDGSSKGPLFLYPLGSRDAHHKNL